MIDTSKVDAILKEGFVPSGMAAAPPMPPEMMGAPPGMGAPMPPGMPPGVGAPMPPGMSPEMMGMPPGVPGAGMPPAAGPEQLAIPAGAVVVNVKDLQNLLRGEDGAVPVESAPEAEPGPEATADTDLNELKDRVTMMERQLQEFMQAIPGLLGAPQGGEELPQEEVPLAGLGAPSELPMLPAGVSIPSAGMPPSDRAMMKIISQLGEVG